QLRAPESLALWHALYAARRAGQLFFFQAEDGIRDGHVTGVQTCALPIFFEAMNTRMASKMLVTGTFSICALSRSTSTKICGVAAWNVVNTLAMPGVRLASATNSCVTRAN